MPHLAPFRALAIAAGLAALWCGCSSDSGSEGSDASGAEASTQHDAAVQDGPVGASEANAGDAQPQGCGMTECFRAITCVANCCGGPIVSSGCCPCDPPYVDSLTCNQDASCP